MQSLQSFISRNNFSSERVLKMITELGITTIKGGKATFITKDSANELRIALLKQAEEAKFIA